MMWMSINQELFFGRIGEHAHLRRQQSSIRLWKISLHTRTKRRFVATMCVAIDTVWVRRLTEVILSSDLESGNGELREAIVGPIIGVLLEHWNARRCKESRVCHLEPARDLTLR